jgi:hypothetical protein
MSYAVLPFACLPPAHVCLAHVMHVIGALAFLAFELSNGLSHSNNWRYVMGYHVSCATDGIPRIVCNKRMCYP